MALAVYVRMRLYPEFSVNNAFYPNSGKEDTEPYSRICQPRSWRKVVAIGNDPFSQVAVNQDEPCQPANKHYERLVTHVTNVDHPWIVQEKVRRPGRGVEISNPRA